MSLQESGIFESQYTEESGSTSRNEDVSRELTTLTSQIESLVLRFTEGTQEKDYDDSKGDFTSPHSRNEGGGTSKRGNLPSPDVSSELKFCRQRIEEFERRLTQFADLTYIHSLEDKVAILIHQNQKLEEERAEMEEAENDSRHECQRYIKNSFLHKL